VTQFFKIFLFLQVWQYEKCQLLQGETTLCFSPILKQIFQYPKVTFFDLWSL